MSTFDDIAACAAVYAEQRAAADTSSGPDAEEAVLRARLALAECLRSAGWSPSEQVADGLQRDRDLLALPLDAFERYLLRPPAHDADAREQAADHRDAVQDVRELDADDREAVADARDRLHLSTHGPSDREEEARAALVRRHGGVTRARAAAERADGERARQDRASTGRHDDP